MIKKVGVWCLMFGMLTCDARQRLLECDIQEIYERFVKPSLTPNYAKLYVDLPLQENNNPHWKWEDKDLPRVIALLEFKRFVGRHNLSCEKGLAINGAVDPEWYCLPAKKITYINYADDIERYDLHCLNLLEKDFDFVMANQTLEHIYDPVLCLENIYKHMAYGGILYINVPANNIPHATPFHHYTGYTPVGLGAVVKSAGFEIIAIGQWGNKKYLQKMFELDGWPDYRGIADCYYNDFICPIITWVFARK